ncbi:hypothetical protein ACFVWF_27950 [Rhodococcus qingshengii]|uniref:hypothetical protein n=1 Tax=Rhodococcus qingshengii TaxID=334542 RepID=UPI0036DA6C4E
MTIERHQSVIDTDYHQFMIEAGPLRELIHGQNPDFPLAMFAGDLLRVNVGVKKRAGERHRRGTPNAALL